MTPIRVAILVFDGVDLMDVAIPLEVMALGSDGGPDPRRIEVVLVSIEPERRVTATPRLVFEADRCIADVGIAGDDRFDAVIVPGGEGLDVVLEKHLPAVRLWLTARAADPRTGWITSVCAGALLLAACGLLDEHRATTHWASLDLLRMFGKVRVIEEGYPRVVICGDRMTSGGVSSGAELGLALKQRLLDTQAARNTELILQYDPQPPYGVGNPVIADRLTRQQTEGLLKPMIERRADILRRLIGR